MREGGREVGMGRDEGREKGMLTVQLRGRVPLGREWGRGLAARREEAGEQAAGRQGAKGLVAEREGAMDPTAGR